MRKTTQRHKESLPDSTKERIRFIRENLKKGSAFYIHYNSKADYCYDVDSAADDITWLISEVEKLQIEVNDLSSPRKKK